MRGKVNDGSLVTIEPVTDETLLRTGDIVLCKCRKREYLHLIQSAVQDRYRIGNNRGGTNGWIHRNKIFGICVKVEL